MSKIPSPSPAAFDGHWLTPRQMAALAGIGAKQLAALDRAGRLPPGSVRRASFPVPFSTKERFGPRWYDAGKVLAARKHR